jgi:hypothetical protein
MDVEERCDMDDEKIKSVVREGYAKVAKEGKAFSVPLTSCCGSASLAEEISKRVVTPSTTLL